MARALASGRAALTVLLVALAGCRSDGILGIGAASGFAPGTGLHTMDVGPLERSYVLHVPSRRPTTPSGMLLSYPLIIVLHGSGSSGADIRATTNMDSVSEANHTVVAYPNGVKGSGGLFPSDWNAGTCCGAAGRENIDDLGFIRVLITQLSEKLPIDKRRIYVAGFSDGGRMAYHVACQLASQITAIAVVSGSLRDDSCAPTRAVALIAVHGTADVIVPIDEAPDTPPAAGGVSAAHVSPSVQFWVAQDKCGSAAATSYSTHVNRVTFAGCTGSEVAFYVVEGGTHAWPVLTDPKAADPDQTLNATALIAAFFRRQVIR